MRMNSAIAMEFKCGQWTFHTLASHCFLSNYSFQQLRIAPKTTIGLSPQPLSLSQTPARTYWLCVCQSPTLPKPPVNCWKYKYRIRSWTSTRIYLSIFQSTSGTHRVKGLNQCLCLCNDRTNWPTQIEYADEIERKKEWKNWNKQKTDRLKADWCALQFTTPDPPDTTTEIMTVQLTTFHNNQNI